MSMYIAELRKLLWKTNHLTQAEHVVDSKGNENFTAIYFQFTLEDIKRTIVISFATQTRDLSVVTYRFLTSLPDSAP